MYKNLNFKLEMKECSIKSRYSWDLIEIGKISDCAEPYPVLNNGVISKRTYSPNLLHTAAALGLQVLDPETELPADQVENGQLCLTCVN